MPEEDGRRDVRHAVHLSVTIKSGDDREELFTEDVSYRGLFIRTDSPRAARKLVLMDIEGPNGEVLELAGMVVHIIRPGRARTRIPGMGIQLYGLSRDLRKKWVALVDYVAGKHTPRSVHGDALSEDERIRRKFPREPIILQVHVSGMVELTSLYTRNVSKGGMFIETTEQIPAGGTLELELIHPKTSESFLVTAVVRRVVKERGREGVGVEFEGLTPEARDAFWKFVDVDLGTLDEEISSDDPNLE